MTDCSGKAVLWFKERNFTKYHFMFFHKFWILRQFPLTNLWGMLMNNYMVSHWIVFGLSIKKNIKMYLKTMCCFGLFHDYVKKKIFHLLMWPINFKCQIGVGILLFKKFVSCINICLIWHTYVYETENSTSTSTTSSTSPGSSSGLANTVTEPATASPPKKPKGKHLKHGSWKLCNG